MFCCWKRTKSSVLNVYKAAIIILVIFSAYNIIFFGAFFKIDLIWSHMSVADAPRETQILILNFLSLFLNFAYNEILHNFCHFRLLYFFVCHLIYIQNLHLSLSQSYVLWNQYLLFSQQLLHSMNGIGFSLRVTLINRFLKCLFLPIISIFDLCIILFYLCIILFFDLSMYNIYFPL